jgi:hypothetical protein
MAVIEIAKMQVRRGQENQTGMPQLDSGEFGWAEDTEHLYIGKRIVDGAVDDNNTRILTENDLANIFSLVAPGSAVASTSTYKYRDNLPNGYINSVVTSIGTALDNSANLTDWGIVPSTTATDIYSYLNTAVQDLFNNQYIPDAKRQLRIPAGNYYVSDVVYLPPYTSIVGEGRGLTNLILTNSSTNLFQTIDSNGNVYGSMPNSKVTQPKNITLQGMTLLFNTGTVSGKTLLSLDNVYDAKIVDMGFGSLTPSSQVYETLVISSNASEGSSINTFVVDTGAYPEFASIDVTTGVYYVTGSGVYANKFAQLVSSSNSNTTYTFITTSSFGTMDFSTQDETFTLLQYNGWGVGVEARGQYGGYMSDAAKLCANVQIIDCEFGNLHTCIESTGTTSRILVENNVLQNSIHGVVFKYDDSVSDSHITLGPTNGIIKHNRFESIVKEAVLVGPNPDATSIYPTSHVTSQNYFDQCGNDLYISDSNITTSAYAVISFNSLGNRTENDFFNRRMMANDALQSNGLVYKTPAFYYNPLATGSVAITDDSTISVLAPASTMTNICSFPINGQDQYIEVTYQMTGTNVTRKGAISLNVQADGTTNLTDNYYFTEEMVSYNDNTDGMTSVGGSTKDLLVVDSIAYPQIEALLTVNGGNTNFYITGSTKYLDQIAQVISVIRTNDTYQITTQSPEPHFNYTTAGETWTLLQSTTPVFVSTTSLINNAITLACDNVSTATDVVVEYQTKLFF